MCGFAGFLLSSKSLDNPHVVLEAMGDAIRHRGPDDGGLWFDSNCNVGFSHRRLAVVDLSAAGHQPMFSNTLRYVIAFNGEIYNHLKLRAQLEREIVSITWRGHSDTETLLACFEAWGIERTLKAAVGMFALALWDYQSGHLTLARDRMGEKPLYWGKSDNALLFASELKSLRAFPGLRRVVSTQALEMFLKYNYVPAPYSIYENVYKLRPGTFITISQDGSLIAEYTYWNLQEVALSGIESQFLGGDDEAIDLLEERIVDSVAGQVLADVPLGAFLSGGIDSSAIVSLMQKQSSRPVRTFTIGFEDSGFDEAVYARAVAQHLGTDHTELYVGASDAQSIIPVLPKIYCEPFADGSQIPTLLVSRMARKLVTVALSGDGGDELFGGYNTYQFAPRYWRHLSSVPLFFRDFVQKFTPSMFGPDKLQKLLEICNAGSKEQFYDLLMSHWKRPSDILLREREFPSSLNSAETSKLFDSFEHWMMYKDAQNYMVDDILVKVDRAAMYNSLETRVPLLDHRVVEFAWTLPLDKKIRHGKGKWILRELLYRHVPKELIERPKKGFSIPLGGWLRGPLRDWAETLLDSTLLEQQGYFNSGAVRRVWAQHIDGQVDRSRKLWSILMFQAWLMEQDL